MVAIVFQMASCTVYRHVPNGKQLVTKVTVKGAPSAHKDQMMELVEEKTNTKIFGIWRVRTRNWYLTEKWRNKHSKQNTIWEAPSYYTEEGTQNTVDKLESYLKNNGYFNAKVTAKVKIKGLRKRKAEVEYIVSRNKAYTINDVSRNIEDYDIYNILEADKNNSLVKKGKTFSSTMLIDERERILNLLKNHGYYDFSREYVYFDLDSTLGNHKIDVSIGLKNPGLYKRHKVYTIGTIKFSNKDELDTNSVLLAEKVSRTGYGNAYIDDLLLRSMRLMPGDLYREADMQESLKNLRKIKMYQYVDVRFLRDSVSSDTAILNLQVILSPYTKYQIQFQTEAITSEQNGQGLSFNGRLYGMAGSFTFKDNNFLKKGIQMETRLRASSEISLNYYPKVASNNELSLSNSYYFAKPFLARLMPIDMRNEIDQSTLSLNAYYESNPDFSRYTANIAAGYLIEKGRFKHYILPIDFNLISTEIRSERFKTLLDTSVNLYLSNLFDNHTIAGSRWGFYYTNKVIGSKRNYLEITANIIELAGNVFYVGSKIFGTPVQGELSKTYQRTFLDLHFFQFAKGDYDFRFHQKTFWNNEIVYRAYVGMIYPFGNTPNSVPFEKRYYSGGSNSIRGWGVRRLGPGSYKAVSDNQNYIYFHSGDIKLEGNFEYRFSVSNLLKMALFADAGNIWNNPHNTFQVPGGEWQWNRFYKEFAVAGGLGFRFDFTYFVFRSDLGFPLRDPSASANKWFPKEIYGTEKFQNIIRFNFGIGYPF